MNELTNLLAQLNVYNPIDNILSMEPNNIQQIYSSLLPRVLNKKEMNPHSYAKLILFEQADNQAANLCVLLLQTRRACQKLKLGEFYIHDLVEPDIRRTKYFMLEMGKFALFSNRMKAEYQGMLKEGNDILMEIKQSDLQMSLTQQKLFEERSYTQQLKLEEQNMLNLLKDIERNHNLTKHRFEEFQEIFNEEQARLLEQKKQLQQRSDQLFVNQGFKKKLETQLVVNPVAIQEQFNQAKRACEMYHQEFESEKQLKGYHTFKLNTLEKAEKSVAKLWQNLKNLSSRLNDTQDITNSKNDLFKALESQRLQSNQLLEEIQRDSEKKKELEFRIVNKREELLSIYKQNNQTLHKRRGELGELRSQTNDLRLSQKDAFNTRQAKLNEIERAQRIIFDLSMSCERKLREKLLLIKDYELQIISQMQL